MRTMSARRAAAAADACSRLKAGALHGALLRRGLGAAGRRRASLSGKWMKGMLAISRAMTHAAADRTT